MKLITVRLPEEWLLMIDEAVRKGLAADRARAIRDAVRDYLKFHNLFLRVKL